jgi:hypothetical protein
MGFWKNLISKGFSGLYNGAKDILGKIYSPINSVITGVGNFASKVDGVVNDLRSRNIPIVSQVARFVKDNPIYAGVMSGVNTAVDANRTVQEIGSTIDAVAQPTIGAIDSKLGIGMG